MAEQIKWRRALVENQSRTLVERLLERADPQKKIRQFGILLSLLANPGAERKLTGYPNVEIAGAICGSNGLKVFK